MSRLHIHHGQTFDLDKGPCPLCPPVILKSPPEPSPLPPCRHEYIRGHSETLENGSVYIYLVCRFCRHMEVEQYD